MNALVGGFTLLLSAVAGDIYVAEGGRVVVAGTAVDLAGVDAPAPGSDAGRAVQQAIRAFTEGKPVFCRVAARGLPGNARHGICFADGEDIGAELVARGLALDCPRTSNGRYASLEPDGSRDRLSQTRDCQVVRLQIGGEAPMNVSSR